MTSPSPDPRPDRPPVSPSRQGRIPIEPGERFDTPHRWGDPFDLPETQAEERPRSSLAALAGDPDMVVAAFRAALAHERRRDPYALRAPDPPPPELSTEELRLERLRFLAVNAGPTDEARARLKALERDEADLRGTGRPVPSQLAGRLGMARRALADALERDEIAAERPDDPCLGAGAWGDEVALTIVVGTDAEGRDLLYAEGIEGPMTYRHVCICADGEAWRAYDRERQAAMRQRWAKKRLERLLGAARIPQRMLPLDLSTYPHRHIARRAWRWYATHFREQQARADGRSLQPFLLLHGPNLRGKTGVAIGVLKLALARGVPAVIRTTADLLDELRATYDPGNDACFTELLAALKSAPLLILDDLGAERLTTYAQDVFYSLLDFRRNELLPTMLTTNLGVEEIDGQPSELARWLGQRVFTRVAEKTNGLDFNGLPILEDPEVPRSDAPADPFKDW